MGKKISFDKNDSHIIMLCKGVYNKVSGEISIIEMLRMFHSFICGYYYNPDNKSIDEYIANRLYSIIVKSEQVDLIRFQKKLHNEMVKFWRTEETDINIFIINFYISEIRFLNVYGIKENQMELCDENIEFFNEFFNSNGEYSGELYNKY